MTANDIYLKHQNSVKTQNDHINLMWQALNECDNCEYEAIENGSGTIHTYYFQYDEMPNFSTISNDVHHQIEIKEKLIKAAFQSWSGGKSHLYLASVDGQDSVDAFLKSHNEYREQGNTVAVINQFYNEREAMIAYGQIDNNSNNNSPRFKHSKRGNKKNKVMQIQPKSIGRGAILHLDMAINQMNSILEMPKKLSQLDHSTEASILGKIKAILSSDYFKSLPNTATIKSGGVSNYKWSKDDCMKECNAIIKYRNLLNALYTVEVEIQKCENELNNGNKMASNYYKSMLKGNRAEKVKIEKMINQLNGLF